MAKAKKSAAKTRGGKKPAPKKTKRVVYIITKDADQGWVNILQRHFTAHDVRLVDTTDLAGEDAEIVVFMRREALREANDFRGRRPDPALRVIMLTGGLMLDQEPEEGVIVVDKASNEIFREILGE